MIRVERVELDAIFALRAEVLRDGQPIASAAFDGDDAPGTLHLAAIDGDGVVSGCVSVMRATMPGDPTRTRQLRGMAVAEHERNRGIGGLLLAEVDRREPAAALWCNARRPARRFYERHGWAAVSAPFDIAHHGPHVRMLRDAAAQ
ncbi:MAG: GNAT family N-acetyltransferase [Planctomycetota bacterium]